MINPSRILYLNILILFLSSPIFSRHLLEIEILDDWKEHPEYKYLSLLKAVHRFGAELCEGVCDNQHEKVKGKAGDNYSDIFLFRKIPWINKSIEEDVAKVLSGMKYDKNEEGSDERNEEMDEMEEVKNNINNKIQVKITILFTPPGVHKVLFNF